MDQAKTAAQKPAADVPAPGTKDEQQGGVGPTNPPKAGYAVGQTSFDPPDSGAGGSGGTKSGYPVDAAPSFDETSGGTGGSGGGKAGGYATEG
jgi:hypothetical protein